MTVFEVDGQFVVKSSKRGTAQVGPFDTSAEAWRWIDRYNGEPISRAEKTAEYIWLKSIDQ